MASTGPAGDDDDCLHKNRGIWFRFGYNEDTDKPNDTRNVLLIVAALITAVTFQAGVNPPGGVWQETKDGHTAGIAIYAAQKGPFFAYLLFNTMAHSTSILVLISLTCRFPFYLELWVAIFSMFATYAAAIFAVAPDESVQFRFLLLTALAPFAVRCSVDLFTRLRRRRRRRAAAPDPPPIAINQL